MKSKLLFCGIVFLLVLIFAGNLYAQAGNDYVVIILDGSGSMGDRFGRSDVNKMEAAKNSLKEVLGQIPETTQVGLLVISHSAKSEWVYQLGKRDDKKLFPAIDAIRAGGNTPLNYFMKVGANRLLAEQKKEQGVGTYRLLIVTDGEATDGEEYRTYVPEIIKKGLIVDVIGVNMTQEHKFAKGTGAKYHSANDPVSLKEIITKIFAEVGGSKNAKLDQETFDLISPIPDEMVNAILKALTNPGNSPAGEKPSDPPASLQGESKPQEATPIPAAKLKPQAQATTANNNQLISTPQTNDARILWIVIGCLVGIIVIAFMIAALVSICGNSDYDDD